MTETVRIKKGVRPFGGRRVQVLKRYTYPNGRKVVEVVPPGERSRGMRLYNEDEVEDSREQES